MGPRKYEIKVALPSMKFLFSIGLLFHFYTISIAQPYATQPLI